MRNETAFKKWLKDNKPPDVWWYNIPSQAGKAGLQLPFDSVCCIRGAMVAMEFKWNKFNARPHQAIALGEVHHAGGTALLICGMSSAEGAPIQAKVYVYPFTDRSYSRISLARVWPQILKEVSKRS